MSRRWSAADLTTFATQVLIALGTPSTHAAVIAESLVESDLRGHDSHGVRRLVPYAALARADTLQVTAEPTLVEGTPPAVVVVDGRNTFGQLTARMATEELIRRVEQTSIAIAVLRHCQHVGRLGEYVEQAAAAGHVALAMANADPTVAPWGGRERMLGTNPFAWAAPVADGAPPLVVDFATSATAEGKLAVARASGQQVPGGLILDANGEPTTDPADFYAGGALLPFGGHKGYGLGLIADVVAGLLSGTGSASAPGYDGTFGTVLIAVKTATFVDVDAFTRDVEDLRTRLHAGAPAPGTERVLLPGEPEWITRAHRIEHGVAVAPGTVEALQHLAAELGVPGLDADRTSAPQPGDGNE
ncbi:Ldh family oxidoreductase [Mycolicibacterium sp. S2-37]|uniref:Ldh family oxidoreductase n=1 Tax=Mycolicibacterium sp. S2-37 TaxID=2810297 RepID=UPI001A942631|nr:Ldh family oxidoreductase [Mycolicibacterium sp. S2-37]MBO0678492.1 Ldh family oxidoreductase [Mycolicibacterium sp. S2-37]